MDHINVGKKGEDIACKHLKNLGHRIVLRNYRMKFGEIDIVSEKGKRIFFTEVKTVAHESADSSEEHRPEDNVTEWKMKKLSRVVRYYLSSQYPDTEPRWEFFVIAIVLNLDKKTAEVNLIKEPLNA